MISPFLGFNATLHRARGVKVGKDVLIASDVFIDAMEPSSVILEDNVAISPRVSIIAHTNPTPARYEYLGGRTVEPVRIREGTWLCIGVTVLPGVTVGKYCIIGAGAVVKKDIPDFSLAVGVPAKQVKILKKEYTIPREATVAGSLVLTDDERKTFISSRKNEER
jgi:maltose O-acetyltransferase